MTNREEFTAWYLAAMIDLLGKGIESQARLNLDWLREDGSFADPSLRLALMAWEAARINPQPVGTFPKPESGHAIPQWLRDHFSAIEDEAMRMGGCAVFTQMRTKVQAYFETLRADLSYAVVLTERNELKAENDRLQRFETAYKEFSDKTDWVRPNAAAHELGMHVADILRKRCDDLTSHNQAQAEEIVRLRVDVERFDFIASDAESGLQRIYGDDWLAAVDAAMGKEPRP